MSFEAVLWATSDAPIANVNEFAVLIMLAEKADSDGCNAFPARATVARRTTVDPKTVQRTISALAARKLIGPGDDRAAEYIRADRRPSVWDLLIPYDWFPNIDRINADRAKRGKGPLTPASRPPIAQPPAKSARSDKGKQRPKRGSDAPSEAAPKPVNGRGDFESSRETGPGNGDGGTASPARGDSESCTGGLEDPRTSSTNPVIEPSPSSRVEADGTNTQESSPTQGGGGGEAPQQDKQDSTATAFVGSLPYGARLPGMKQREQLIARVSQALAAGWTELSLRTQLTEETSTAKSLVAVYRHRLDPENLPEAPAFPAPRTADQPRSRPHRAKCPECHRPLRDSAEDTLCSDCREDMTA